MFAFSDSNVSLIYPIWMASSTSFCCRRPNITMATVNIDLPASVIAYGLTQNHPHCSTK